MQPFYLARQLRSDFIDYVSSKFPFVDKGALDLDQQLRSIMQKDGSLFQDPVIQLVRSRKKQKADLDQFHPQLLPILKNLKELETPYIHQVKAWDRINRGEGTVISTGTGSGKSESFILPVINGLLQKGYGKTKHGIGAIFVYPMNALVHDQFYRIIKYAAGTGIRVGIYNGAFKDLKPADRKKIIEDIKKIREDLQKQIPGIDIDQTLLDVNTLVVDPKKPETIPHILLTNYKMLEYMLLRSSDQALFDSMNLEYLALDEAHTYTGTLALEMSCLLNRLKMHLGDKANRFVPIATSATLSQGPDQDEKKVDTEMRDFFGKLFGSEFKGDDWLLKDVYEDIQAADIIYLKSYLKFDTDALAKAVASPFPESLHLLAKQIFNVEDKNIEALAQKLVPGTQKLAPHLLSVLLKDENGQVSNMISWKTAIERFQAATGGSAALLEALLILSSHAYEQKLFPAIGVRYHLFGRAQPRIYWSIDQKSLHDDSTKRANDLNFVSCRKCGHMAVSALLIPMNAGGAEVFAVDKLPDRFDEDNLSQGMEAVVLHHESSIPNNGEHLPQSWKEVPYLLSEEDGKLTAIYSTRSPLPHQKRMVRFLRTAKKNNNGKKESEEASDFYSCPCCAGTSDSRPVMNSHISSASIDLSIHAASLLSKTSYDGTSENDNKERKLLIFCDNRQETSFLAGFLTDRHRRHNLRRSIASFLNENKKAGDLESWQLKGKKSAESRLPECRRFDFAIRLLMSLKKGELVKRGSPLPQSFFVEKTLIQNLLPREVLQANFRERFVDERINTLREWLLENYSIDERLEGQTDEQIDILNDSEKSLFVLEMLTNVIVLDNVTTQVKEGHLAHLGLATTDFPQFNLEKFNRFAAANPKLGLSGSGLFAVATWLIEELAYCGAIADIDLNTVRQFVNRLWSSNPRPKLADLLGKSATTQNRISPSSELGRLLKSYSTDSNILNIWANKSSWINLIQNSPLSECVFLSAVEQDEPVLKFTDSLHLTSQVKLWKSEFTGVWRASASRHNYLNMFTGKKEGDVWTEVQIPSNTYYHNLFLQPLSSEARLVTAKEHNGMISSADQNEAVTKFKTNRINTLVATPTLEMGVDLPDLPTVVHRSVPPDPSNYAQRAGRAGRGPKRALIFTYCGNGSHDMTFFESPIEMASGEILPPGIPVENTYIIQRHVNGLVLEAMGMERPESEPLDLKSWDRLVDLSEPMIKAQAILNPDETVLPKEPQKWREIFQKRKPFIQKMLNQFLKMTEENLWKHLSADLRQSLKQTLIQEVSIESWPDAFDKQLKYYLDTLNNYLEEVLRLGSKTNLDKQRMSNEDKIAYERAFIRAAYFSKLYLGIGSRFDLPQPISDMATTGFLPNFDFPGRVTRFRGVKVNKQSTDNKKYIDLLKYDRSAIVALREFAPEQKIYGHGWIYKVDRYVSSENVNVESAGWGLCSSNCTELIPPDNKECPKCHSAVLRIGDGNNGLLPELIEVKEVHGSQDRVISDSSSRREMNYFTADLKLVGAPLGDRAKALKSDSAVQMHYHTHKPSFFKIMQIVHRRDSQQRGHQQNALWREKTEGSSFAVKLNPPPPETRNEWRPFFPAVFSDCPGIRIKLPIHVASSHQWIQGLSDLPDTAYDQFYKTFSAVMERSVQKVLRLNKRTNNLEITEHRIMAPSVHDQKNRIESLEILILDNERGGSGLIPMIESYWDQIMETCSELIKKKCCDEGCYRCLKSFDNQWDHAHIKKSLFLVNGKAPLFEALKKSQWKDIEVGHGQETDQNSVAETFLGRWLRENGISYTTQNKFSMPDGTEITVSDFAIDHADRKLQLFVDGWEHHGNIATLLKDIEKRNYLAKRGWSVVWIPGHWPSQPEALEKLKKIVTSNSSLDVFKKRENRFALPNEIEAETQKRLMEGLRSDLYQIKSFDLADFNDPRTEILDSALNELKKMYHPIALSEDRVVLFMVNGTDILKEKATWNHWCTMISAVSALNYRPLIVWLGERQPRSRAA